MNGEREMPRDWHINRELMEADQKIDGPHGCIQWKGTDVYIDLHCECGHHGHIDGDFFYFYRCHKCKKEYAVGSNVKLIPLNAEQSDYANNRSCGVQEDDEDTD